MDPRRRAWLVAFALGPIVARAAAARRRVGILLVGDEKSSAQWREELAAALKPLGWNEDNLQLVLPPGDNLDSRLAALMLERFDVLVANGTPPTLALHRAAGTVPIVAQLSDPVGSGVARSLAIPGGHVTGISGAPPDESYPKLLELARAVVPRMRKLWLVRPVRYEFAGFALWRRYAEESGLAYEERPIELRFAPFGAALDEAARAPGSGVLLANFGDTAQRWRPLVKMALERGLPTFSPFVAHCQGGGLLSYERAFVDPTKSLAVILDKVLRGGDPARIPFELPTHTRFALNLAAARTLGLAVPPELLMRADMVLETTPAST